MSDIASQFPLEFFLEGTPISQQGSSKSKQKWKDAVAAAALARREKTYELGFIDERALAVTIYYFASAPMEGDVDNVVKPILDALIATTYTDDRVVERVVAQKFEPEGGWQFAAPSEQLTAALDRAPPVVYVQVTDDLEWRML
jgi:hypothetical protein